MGTVQNGWFMSLRSEIGNECAFCMNLSSVSPKRVQQFTEYCSHSIQENAMASWVLDMGIDKHLRESAMIYIYGVIKSQIGNEMWTGIEWRNGQRQYLNEFVCKDILCFKFIVPILQLNAAQIETVNANLRICQHLNVSNRGMGHDI